MPGYLRVPGSAMTTAPPTTSMRTASHTVTGPGLQPSGPVQTAPARALQPAVHAVPASSQPAVPASTQPAVPASTQPAVAAVPAVPTPDQPDFAAPRHAMPAVPLPSKAQSQANHSAVTTSMPVPSLPSPVWSPEASQPGFLSTYIPTESQQTYNADRKRLQSKDLPEQHRLPDDLPESANNHAKSATSATGPLSAEMPVLPSFHEEIVKFVEQAAPNQTEQLTKVCLQCCTLFLVVPMLPLPLQSS